MILRLLNRLKRDVFRLASSLRPDRVVTLHLDSPLGLCFPFIEMRQLEEHLSSLGDLNRLAHNFGQAQLTFLTISNPATDKNYADTIAISCKGELVSVPDFRSLISVLTTMQAHLVIPSEIKYGDESLVDWCRAFHVHFYESVEKLVEELMARGQIKLSGPFLSTYSVFKSLSGATKGGGQYGFLESLNWEVIKRLPMKFKELSSSAKINAYPIALLLGKLGRLERQRTVGRLYKEYLQGESVLDLGCDVRGVEEFVGKHTRYCGVDVHGKPDILVNLDQDDFPFEERSFHTIVCVETLEHLQKMHSIFDAILCTSERYVVCSLPVEFSHAKNRFTDSFGAPSSSAFTPIAPVFDRHEWLGGVSDNLDFIYYRSALGGFEIKRIDLFYFPKRLAMNQDKSIVDLFARVRIYKLNKTVGMMIFVLERKN